MVLCWKASNAVSDSPQEKKYKYIPHNLAINHSIAENLCAYINFRIARDYTCSYFSIFPGRFRSASRRCKQNKQKRSEINNCVWWPGNFALIFMLSIVDVRFVYGMF